MLYNHQHYILVLSMIRVHDCIHQANWTQIAVDLHFYCCYKLNLQCLLHQSQHDWMLYHHPHYKFVTTTYVFMLAQFCGWHKVLTVFLVAYCRTTNISYNDFLTTTGHSRLLKLWMGGLLVTHDSKTRIVKILSHEFTHIKETLECSEICYISTII